MRRRRANLDPEPVPLPAGPAAAAGPMPGWLSSDPNAWPAGSLVDLRDVAAVLGIQPPSRTARPSAGRR
jgi:hypothetical protein